MSMMQKLVLILVLVAMPRMAAAQTRDWEDWADDIARRFERQADQIAKHVERQADQWARQIETRADQWERYFERRFEAQGRGGRGRGNRGPEYTENFSRTARLGRNGSFDLQNVAGDISVTGGGGVSATGGAVELQPASTTANTTRPPLRERTECQPIMLCLPFLALRTGL